MVSFRPKTENGKGSVIVMKKMGFIVLALIIMTVTTAACSTKDDEADNGTLTLATWHASDALIHAVEGFNKSQTQYQIELKDYGQYDNYEGDTGEDYIKGQTMLNMDIAAGNIPDIINLHGIDRTIYAKSGAFVNLYDMMKSDEKYSEDAFLANYLKANEIEGGLYWLAPTFFVDTLIANQTMTNGMTKWSTEKFLEVSKAALAYHVEIMDHQHATEFMTFIGAGNQFLNQINETVYYDNPVYAAALEFSAKLEESAHDHDGHEHGHSHETVSADEDAKKYQNGQRLLLRGTFGNLYEYMSYFALFGDQPATMIGYPTLNGTSGTYFGMGHELYAISASSKAPEGAWEYLKYALDFDIETANKASQFSVVVDKLEKQLQMSMESYTDGKYTTRRDVNLNLEKPTQADLDELMAVLKGIESFANYESMFSKEIYGIMDDYYAGTKTSTEVAQLLQNKYTLFFKENQ